jgi:hypothetical protein
MRVLDGGDDPSAAPTMRKEENKAETAGGKVNATTIYFAERDFPAFSWAFEGGSFWEKCWCLEKAFIASHPKKRLTSYLLVCRMPA